MEKSGPYSIICLRQVRMGGRKRIQSRGPGRSRSREAAVDFEAVALFSGVAGPRGRAQGAGKHRGIQECDDVDMDEHLIFDPPLVEGVLPLQFEAGGWKHPAELMSMPAFRLLSERLPVPVRGSRALILALETPFRSLGKASLRCQSKLRECRPPKSGPAIAGCFADLRQPSAS